MKSINGYIQSGNIIFSTEKAKSEVPQTTAKIIKRKTADIRPIK
ncbi:DUF1697 domain-containing protein [Treponema vincentii]